MKALGFIIAPVAAIAFALPMAGAANAGPGGKHYNGGGDWYNVAGIETYTQRISHRIRNQKRRIRR
ncbi:MAG: hypothetical protein AAFV69_13980, partial [Pseudomonadota bacterium]